VIFAARPARNPHAALPHVLEEAIMVTILLVILILMLLGAIPAWPHSRSWGYAPSGSLGLIVIIILLLVLTGRL
jgi:VIT1/CCC1 family predicted Fe2+/Mn2+ transporter